MSSIYRLYDDTLNTADTSWRSRTRTAKLEKLKCLMNYFRRCIERRPFSPVDNNDIIFERRVLPPGDLIDWGECNQPLLKMKAFSKGAIEDAENRLQVDFANEFVGKYQIKKLSKRFKYPIVLRWWNVRKWCSNGRDLLHHLPRVDCVGCFHGAFE